MDIERCPTHEEKEVDTSPAALRALADQWHSTPGPFLAIHWALRGTAMEAALRAVAAEKERFIEEQQVDTSAAYWAGFDDGRAWVEQKQDEVWL